MLHFLWRKTNPYEGSSRVPFVLAWPTGRDFAPGVPEVLAEVRDVPPAGVAGLSGRLLLCTDPQNASRIGFQL